MCFVSLKQHEQLSREGKQKPGKPGKPGKRPVYLFLHGGGGSSQESRVWQRAACGGVSDSLSGDN